MKDFFNRLILGPAHSSFQKEKSSDEKRIYFTGVFSIVSAFACIPYTLIYFYYQYYTIGFTVLIFSATFLLSTFLNRKQYYSLSKNLFIVTSNLSIFVYSLLLGSEAGVYFLFIAAVAGTAVIFPISKSINIFYHFITSIVLFTILEIVYSYHIDFFPIAGTLKHALFITSYASTLIMVFICNLQQNAINEEVETSLRENQERSEVLLNELRLSEANLNVIFENTIKSFVLIGKNQEALYYNTKLKNLIASTTGRQINIGERLFDNPSEFRDYFLEVYESALLGASGSRERELVLASGGKIFIEVGYAPAFDKKGEIYGVLLSAMNITERKKYEIELEKAKDLAEAAANAKSDFLSNMSHEMRTPLNAIIGFTDLLLQENISENLHENIQAIKYSSENLNILINDILDLAKIDAGKVTIENIPFNIKNLLAQTTNLVKVKALSKGIQFNYSIDETIPEFLIGDPARLNQIILNLTSNAVKFTEQGSVFVNISTTFRSKQRVILKITVKDTGIGIREEKLENIFDSFTQAESDISRKYGGTGLGLSITKKLVELFKGEISIQSVLNQGSEFIVELPFEISKKVNLEKESFQQNYTQLKGVKVLLAEDNNFNLLLLSKILNKWGIEIDVVNNGAEALDLLRKKHYDLVLMDIQMPELTGLEATEYIRKEGTDVLNPKVPIVAISADAYTESKSAALKAGMTDYITKPFKQQELFDILLKNLPERQEGSNRQLIQDETEKLYNEESPTLDIEYLRAHIATDENVLKELLSLYLNTTAAGLEKLDKDFQTGNKEGIKNTAHKIKSSFLSIGYKRTSKLLMLVEKNAESQNEEFLGKLITLIHSDFEKSEEAIKKLLDN